MHSGRWRWSIAEWIQQYGYGAIFVASLFEGELVQVTAGIAARGGHLQWWLACLVGSIGTWLGTQLWFLGGRFAGDRILERRPDMLPRVERARELLDRYGIGLFVGYRFIYGIRTVVPLAIGMSGVAPVRFMVIDALSWLVWFSIVSSLGFYMGETALGWLEALAASQQYILPAVLLGGSLVWLARHRRNPDP